MSYPANWNTNKIQGSTTISTETTTPIVGNGSIAINATVSPERVTLQNTTYINGLTSGKIRSICQVTNLTSTGEERFGFTFMQSSPTIYGVTDAGYGVLFNGITSLGGTPRLSVVKFTTGLPNTPIELASSVAFTNPTLGGNFVFEAQWITDLGTYGGVQIIVRYGLGTNFASLSDKITIIDTTSPLITSAYESLALSFSGTGQLRVLYDETYIYQIV